MTKDIDKWNIIKTGKPASTSQPAGEPASTSQSAGEPASTPQPAGEPASTPQPAGEPASTSQPAGEPASTPQPAGEPASTLNLLGSQPPPLNLLGSQPPPLNLLGNQPPPLKFCGASGTNGVTLGPSIATPQIVRNDQTTVEAAAIFIAAKANQYKMHPFPTEDWDTLLQKITMMEMKILRLEVNVEINAGYGNEMTLPMIQSQ
ncbi:hypothetical protein CRENBAI_011570 [Crenichthys baileyi]|uniref:Uncharacterized protein n=1 Tax=Crenichthys baileyi TaxID=28760 RepID=A0AAV9RFM7_9TELE